jgi:hypothetical protein
MWRGDGCQVGTELLQSLANIGYFLEGKRAFAVSVKRKARAAYARTFDRWQQHSKGCVQCRNALSSMITKIRSTVEADSRAGLD